MLLSKAAGGHPHSRHSSGVKRTFRRRPGSTRFSPTSLRSRMDSNRTSTLPQKSTVLRLLLIDMEKFETAVGVLAEILSSARQKLEMQAEEYRQLHLIDFGTRNFFGIEWTEKTWNPIVGCSEISPGCAKCYAMRLAVRLKGIALAKIKAGMDPGRFRHYIDVVGDNGHWNGKIVFVPEALGDPLRWKKLKMIFVNSMSDMFHENLPIEDIRKICEVMREAKHHIFQVLTKRAERMAELLCGPLQEFAALPNVWWGVSVENRQHGIPRIAPAENSRESPLSRSNPCSKTWGPWISPEFIGSSPVEKAAAVAGLCSLTRSVRSVTSARTRMSRSFSNSGVTATKIRRVATSTANSTMISRSSRSIFSLAAMHRANLNAAFDLVLKLSFGCQSRLNIEAGPEFLWFRQGSSRQIFLHFQGSRGAQSLKRSPTTLKPERQYAHVIYSRLHSLETGAATAAANRGAENQGRSRPGRHPAFAVRLIHKTEGPIRPEAVESAGLRRHQRRSKAGRDPLRLARRTRQSTKK